MGEGAGEEKGVWIARITIMWISNRTELMNSITRDESLSEKGLWEYGNNCIYTQYCLTQLFTIHVLKF